MSGGSSELPESWLISPVQDLGHVQLGKMLDRAKNSGTSATYLRNINVRWCEFDLSDLKSVLVSDDEREKFSVMDGDLFICEGGEPGRCAVWKSGKSDVVYQKALHRFRSNGAIVPELLMYRLRLEAEVGSLQESFSGSTIKHFTRESLVKYKVPLPPLAEQKRIVDKLEAVLGLVDACRARLDRVPALLKRFRQSVLAAATSGSLTEEWRNENKITDSWVATTTDSLFEFVTSGSRGLAKYYSDTGAAFLRIGNLNHDDIGLDLQDIQHVTPPLGAEGIRTLVQPRDILISITADVGMVALVPDGIGVAYINQHVALARPIAGIDTRFLAWVLASNPIKNQWKDMQRGATKVGLSLGDIRAIELGIPSLPEQQEIVRRVEDLFAFADRIEARLATAQKTVERVTPATLAKAFRGELVPQDPNDEPASALLEQLKSAEPTPSATKTRRKRSAKV